MSDPCIVCPPDEEVLLETTETASILETPEGATLLETVTEQVVELTSPQPGYIEFTGSGSQLIDADPAVLVEIVSEGPQAIPEDQVAYAKRVDFDEVNDYIYKGQAVPGSLESDPVWRISRISFVGQDQDIVEEWAGGNANFDKVWDDREDPATVYS